MIPSLKITRYDRSDIESGLIEAPRVGVDFRVFWNVSRDGSGAIRDTEYSTIIKYALALSMIKNWMWKYEKYSDMLGGPNGVRKLVDKIRRQLRLYIKEENSIIRDSGKLPSDPPPQSSPNAIRAQFKIFNYLDSCIQSILDNSQIEIQENSTEGKYFNEYDTIDEAQVLDIEAKPRGSRSRKKESRSSQDDGVDKSIVISTCILPESSYLDIIPFSLEECIVEQSKLSVQLSKPILKWNSNVRSQSVSEIVKSAVASMRTYTQNYKSILFEGSPRNFKMILAKYQYFQKLKSLREFFENLKREITNSNRSSINEESTQPANVKISHSEESRARELIDKQYPQFAIKKIEQQNIETTILYLQNLIGTWSENDLPKPEAFKSEVDFERWLAKFSDGGGKGIHNRSDAAQLFKVPFQKWEELKEIFANASRDLVGRDAELNAILQIIISFAKNYKMTRKSFLNFALLGPPGTGKTTLAKYIGKIFAASGILVTGDFKEVTRTTLVSQYLGATAHQTMRAMEESREGVIFLDEAYALTPCADKVQTTSIGDGKCPKCTKWDEYGSEALNVIVPYLTNNQGMIVMIVAGYTEDTLCTFYAANVGIPRRFPYTFILKGLTTAEMRKVFVQSVQNISNNRVKNMSERALKLLIYILKNFREDFLPNGIGDIENFANFTVEKTILQNFETVDICTLAMSFDSFVWNMYGSRFECNNCCSDDVKQIPEIENLKEEGESAEFQLQEYRKLEQQENQVKSDLTLLVQSLSDEEHEPKPQIENIQDLKSAISELQQIHDDLQQKMKRIRPRPPSPPPQKKYELVVRKYRLQRPLAAYGEGGEGGDGGGGGGSSQSKQSKRRR